MGQIQGARQLKAGDYMGQRKVAVALYDFATDGGAVSTITLRGDSIPSGAYIVDAYAIVETAFTSSGSATVAVTTGESAADLNSADAYSGAPWSTATIRRLDALVGADKGIKTTAARTAQLVIGTAALTAGKAKIVVEYFEMASQT
jgi:hypothetical protein